MKKMMKLFGFIAVAAMSLTACQNDIDEQVNANNEGVTLEVVADMGTRSYFGEKVDGAYPSTWTGNEQVQFAANDGAGFKVTNTESGATTHLSATFTTGTTTEDGVIFAMSPVGDYKTGKGGWGSYSWSYGNVYLTIPAVQTPIEQSVDEAAHILFAEHKYEGAFPTGTIGMAFKHALAYGKMTLTLPDGVEASQVILHFPVAVAGNSVKRYIKEYTDDEKTYQPGEFTGADQRTITLNAGNVVDGVYWFGLLPIGMLEGDMEIEVVATNGDIYKKTIAVGGDLEFNQGRVSSFKVTMAACTPETDPIVTFDFSKMGYANATAVKSATSSGFTVTFNKGTASTDATYYNTGTAVRMYGGSNLNIQSATYVMEKIIFTFSTDDGTNKITADRGTFTTNTWTGAAKTVTFNVEAVSGHRRIKAIEIYYTDSTVVPVTISFPNGNAVLTSAEQSGTFNTTIDGDDKANWTFTVTSNAAWMTVESALNAKNQIVYAAAQNTVPEDRTATITVTATKDGEESVVNSFTVTQDAAPAADSNYYVKVDTAQTDYSGTYLIVFSDNKAHATHSNKDLAATTGTLLISDGKIEQTDDTKKAEVTIAKSGTGYSIKLPSGKYLNCSTNSNQVGSGTSAFAFTISISSNGASISGKDSAGNTRYIYQNGNYFRAYKSNSSYKLPTLYKLEQ